MTQYAVTPLGHTLLIPEQRRAERRSIGAIGDHAVKLLTEANARIAELEAACKSAYALTSESKNHDEARNALIEECAKVCDPNDAEPATPWEHGYVAAERVCASDIRKLKSSCAA